MHENGRALQSRKIQIATKIFDKLTHGDVVASPQWNAVYLHTKPRGGEIYDQGFIALQLLAGTLSKRVGPGQSTETAINVSLSSLAETTAGDMPLLIAQNWYQFREETLANIAREWLEEHKLPYK